MTLNLNTHIEGYRFEDLKVGMTAAFGKTITEADVLLFAGVSGDTNSLHVNEEFAKKTRFGKRIAHGMLSASLISTVLGTKLPGPGAIYMSQTLKFVLPVYLGDTVEARVTVAEINTQKRRIVMQTECTVGGEQVVVGEALIWVPPPEELAKLHG
jgi:3-hydroxybutyryl-CoA dehydratase